VKESVPWPSVETIGHLVTLRQGSASITLTPAEAATLATELNIHAGRAAAIEAAAVNDLVDWMLSSTIVEVLRRPGAGHDRRELNELQAKYLIRELAIGNRWRRTLRGDVVLGIVDQILAEEAGPE
jgi:hypothetical protein